VASNHQQPLDQVVRILDAELPGEQFEPGPVDPAVAVREAVEDRDRDVVLGPELRLLAFPLDARLLV